MLDSARLEGQACDTSNDERNTDVEIAGCVMTRGVIANILKHGLDAALISAFNRDDTCRPYT